MPLNAKEARTLVDTIAGALGTVQKAIYALTDGGKPAISEERSAHRPDTPMPKAQAPQMSSGPNAKTFDDGAMERMYQAFKNRIIDEARVDKVLLHLLTTQPEIIVDVEPQIVELDGATLKGRVARMMAGGWFEGAKTVSAARRELTRTGTDPSGNSNLKNCLDGYVKDGFLVRDGDGYMLSPGVKVSERTVSTR